MKMEEQLWEEAYQEICKLMYSELDTTDKLKVMSAANKIMRSINKYFILTEGGVHHNESKSV